MGLFSWLAKFKEKSIPLPEDVLRDCRWVGTRIAGDAGEYVSTTDVGEGYEVKVEWDGYDSDVDVTLFKNKVRICEANFYRVYAGSRTGTVKTWPEFADMDEYEICEKVAWAMREAKKIRKMERVKRDAERMREKEQSEAAEYKRNKKIYDSNKRTIDIELYGKG